MKATRTGSQPGAVLWEEHVPGGNHWSFIMRRGTTLRMVNVEGHANVAMLFFHTENLLERYNMADTLKAQHTAMLTQGHVCYSDLGRVICSITADTCGWHDAIGGLSTAESVRQRYGAHPYQQFRNDMYRNGRDSLLIELGKHGLGKGDLVPNVNFFSKVLVDGDGKMRFVQGACQPGATVDLRFELNALVALTTVPHRLDPSPAFEPGAVQLVAFKSAPDDPCRTHCPENGRGFANTEQYYRMA